MKLAAVAIVAQALVGMAVSLAPDWQRKTMAAIAAIAMLAVTVPVAQIGVIALGAIAGFLFCRPDQGHKPAPMGRTLSRKAGFVCLIVFGVLLLLLPIIAMHHSALALADIFYRTEALVFGGGHVVLPLLCAELVPQFIDDGGFLAGYGAAQALPGPLFTLSAYLGTAAAPSAPLAVGITAPIAIFLPGLLLIAGALPFRAAIAGSRAAQTAITGVNAVVVGILAAALYDPLWTTGILSLADAAIAALGLLLLLRFRMRPLAVVIGSVGTSILLALV